MSEAEDWAAVWVREGQQALDCCVNAAVHQDAVKTSRNDSNTSRTLTLSNSTVQIQLFNPHQTPKRKECGTFHPAGQHR